MTKTEAKKLFKKHYCYASHLKEGGKAWEREMRACQKYKKILEQPKRLPRTVKVSLTELFNRFDSELESRLTECINEHLAEKYGFCNNGYCYTDTIVVSNIDWDTDCLSDRGEN